MYKCHLTNPEQHDPDNFIYIVHGVMNYSGCVDTLVPAGLDAKFDFDSSGCVDEPVSAGLDAKIDLSTADLSKIDFTKFYENINNYSYNEICPNNGGVSQISSINHALRRIQDPDDFYSASLVGRLSQDRMKQVFGSWRDRDISQLATFGNFGFILQPEDQDVWVAWDNDIGTPHDKDKRREFAHKHRGKKKSWIDLLQTPLSYSRDASYNELVINGNPNTPVVGVFYLVMNEKSEIEGKRLAQITMALLKRQLPVVPVPWVKDEENQSEDPEIKEKRRELRGLQMTFQLRQSALEFENYWKQFQKYG